MGLLRNVALAVLTLTFVVFVALFGRIPALRNTPISFLHRLIWVTLPQTFQDVDRKVTGGATTLALSRFGHYLMYEKHPIVLIFFLTLVTASITIFLSAAWSHLSSAHHLAIVLIAPLPYIFIYLSVVSNAGTITSSNHAQHMSTYPYDYTLYHPGQICRTCQWTKPARSKHCSICNTCIARFDHHCVWINNCVTQDNLRWFMALVGSLDLVLFYGTYLAYLLLWPEFQTTVPVTGGQGVINRLSIVLARNPRTGAVGLLALLSAPLATGLLAYHIYLIWAGTTTSETQKWGDLKEDMADGLVWKGTREAVFKHGSQAADGGLTEPPTSWPVSSNQIVVRTIDGRPPTFRDAGAGSRLENDGADRQTPESQWARCWTLSEIENIYDLGFVDNLRDALGFKIP